MMMPHARDIIVMISTSWADQLHAAPRHLGITWVSMSIQSLPSQVGRWCCLSLPSQQLRREAGLTVTQDCLRHELAQPGVVYQASGSQACHQPPPAHIMTRTHIINPSCAQVRSDTHVQILGNTAYFLTFICRAVFTAVA